MKRIIPLSLIITLFTFSSQVKAQVTNGLILHYSFDAANANDDVGSNHGTINGAQSCPDRFGNSNMAFSFSNNGYIFANSISLGNLNQASVSVWLKPDAITFNAGISSLLQIPAHWSIYMNRYTSDGRLMGMFDGSSIDNSANNESNQISTTSWVHFIMTSNSNTTSIYINGQLESTYPEAFVWTDGYSLFLGSQYVTANNFTHYYNGKLDDFRIYNKVLSNLEIDSLYDMSNPVGLAEYKDFNQYKTSPNPCKEFFSITNIDEEISSVEIVNLLGEVVLSKSVNGKTIKGLSILPEGTYIVRLFKKEEYVGFTKIIKVND